MKCPAGCSPTPIAEVPEFRPPKISTPVEEQDCPTCNGMGSLDEPHLPGGECSTCQGKGRLTMG